MNPNNPLKQYFRQPAIYVKLPSQGKYYPQGSINMPLNGELPVYPMTAIDEITYRTPDALYNGQATVNVIQSCVPDIKNGWDIPSNDMDTLLVAIRIATYGHDMDFTTTCPACKHESDQTLDLRAVLDSINGSDYNQTIKSGDMEIYFKPLTYKNMNDNSQMQFENQKLLQLLPDSDAPESDKLSALSGALKKLTEITVDALAHSISTIKTPQALVSETDYIREFLTNCDRKLFNQVRDFIIDIKNRSEMKPLNITCPSCNHEYEQIVTLDMTSFFESAS
jgi:transcription elongation factor Elf1